MVHDFGGILGAPITRMKHPGDSAHHDLTIVCNPMQWPANNCKTVSGHGLSLVYLQDILT